MIGGADVYAQAIAQADRLVLSEIEASFAGNNHFPDLNRIEPGWIEVARERHRAAPPQ